MSTPAVADPMTELTGLVTRLADQVTEQGRQIADLAKPKAGQHQPGQVFGAPQVRSGENPLGSRGYSFLRAVGYASGVLSADECKVELSVHTRLHKAMVDGGGYKKAGPNTLMMPFATEHLGTYADQGLVRDVRDLLAAGVTGYDWQEVTHLRAKHWGIEKALSWVDETAGGSLVAPPQMGELIQLLRNNEVLMAAGARMIPMPPSGRAVWPRQTSAMTAYWVGQSQQVTDSTPGTGDLNLQARKLGVLAKIPNEMFRFASISTEQFVREDMARVMALKLDKSLLEATGSDLEPKGLINYAGITTHTARTVGTDGNTFEAEDVAEFIGKVEEQNATFKSWVMRPLMYAALANRRADGPVAGDRKGNFLFNMLREISTDMDRRRGHGTLEGYPVFKSTQVSKARTKGASAVLSYILGGDFADYIIAASPVVEFLVAREGDTMVTNDQTWVRGIHYVDGAPTREASFALCDQLVVG